MRIVKFWMEPVSPEDADLMEKVPAKVKGEIKEWLQTGKRGRCPVIIEAGRFGTLEARQLSEVTRAFSNLLGENAVVEIFDDRVIVLRYGQRYPN